MSRYAGLYITNRCNMQCRMCDIGQQNIESSGIFQLTNSNRELGPEEWSTILDDLKVDRVQIMGVEPLLYPDFEKLISLIDRPGRLIYLTTNGWLFQKWQDAIVKHCDRVYISIDGLEEEHDKIRNTKGSFGRALDAVEYLVKSNIETFVSTALCPDNLDCAIPFCKMIQELGAKHVVNQYNFIHPDSCKGFDCKPSNFSVYDPTSMDTGKIHLLTRTCRKTLFMPRLRSREEINSYYHEIPREWKISKYNSYTGCTVIKSVVAGERFSILSDGTFIPSTRCWLKVSLGNALNGPIPTDRIQVLKRFSDEMEKKGFPPPCQRLCCAGKVL